jgi:flavin-dependent dehydrogenase
LSYDVVIAGGGLSGLCLAIQLEREVPGARILVAERNRHPMPEAAHKVGESSVEVASHYFRDVLGLSDVLAEELPKFGLRFFLSQGANTDISQRLECGPSRFLYVPSFQIDRGHFENELARRARAARIDFMDGCRVLAVELRGDGEDHTVALERGSGSFRVPSRWVIDATGRSALLKRQLGLGRSSRHDVNAAWFRIDGCIDLDEWSDDPAWRSRVEHSRRLSTNHLMGPGYWVWLIPLAKQRTSVGIVADEGLHAFSDLNTFPRALKWLERWEPQCAAAVGARTSQRMDFLALRRYAQDVKQVFSGDRWCLTGDAGMFVDPCYSPGSDFIGIANGFICDLVKRDLRGETVEALAEAYDRAFRSLAKTYRVTYQRQYPLMGYPRVMTSKIVWDFVMYWGGVALLSFRNKLCDASFMERVRPVMQGFASLNFRMQAFFRAWAAAETATELAPGAFVDYARLGFLAQLNRDLQQECDDDELLERMARNLQLARDLKCEIVAEASRGAAALGGQGTYPSTGHLAEVFAAMGPVGVSPRPGAFS